MRGAFLFLRTKSHLEVRCGTCLREKVRGSVQVCGVDLDRVTAREELFPSNLARLEPASVAVRAAALSVTWTLRVSRSRVQRVQCLHTPSVRSRWPFPSRGSHPWSPRLAAPRPGGQEPGWAASRTRRLVSPSPPRVPLSLCLSSSTVA